MILAATSHSHRAPPVHGTVATRRGLRNGGALHLGNTRLKN
jgi:hypothetical protein